MYEISIFSFADKRKSAQEDEMKNRRDKQEKRNGVRRVKIYDDGNYKGMSLLEKEGKDLKEIKTRYTAVR